LVLTVTTKQFFRRAGSPAPGEASVTSGLVTKLSMNPDRMYLALPPALSSRTLSRQITPISESWLICRCNWLCIGQSILSYSTSALATTPRMNSVIVPLPAWLLVADTSTTGFSPGQCCRSRTVSAAATVLVRSALVAKSITSKKRLVVSVVSAMRGSGPT
jgi:hypothetical protein